MSVAQHDPSKMELQRLFRLHEEHLHQASLGRCWKQWTLKDNWINCKDDPTIHPIISAPRSGPQPPPAGGSLWAGGRKDHRASGPRVVRRPTAKAGSLRAACEDRISSGSAGCGCNFLLLRTAGHFNVAIYPPCCCKSCGIQFGMSTADYWQIPWLRQP